MKCRFSASRFRVVLGILGILMFLPIFFLRTSHGSIDFPETSACIGALILYVMLTRIIGRLQLTSVLVSVMLFTVLVFALVIYIQPSQDHPLQSGGASYESSHGSPEPDTLEEIQSDSDRTQIQTRIDSLAVSGGRAIRNAGLFSGSGTVGMTLGAVGEVTSATAEIFLRTVYSGSNVAGEDSLYLSETSVRESVSPLRVLALVASVFFSLALLAALRYLVLVERKKRTLLWFRIMLVTLVGRVLYVSLGLEDLIRPAISGFSDPDLLLSISPFYVLLFIMAFMNSFRTQWVHYLNRWRKYVALVALLAIMLLSQTVLRTYFDGGLTICSLALGTFIGCVFTILFIFSSIAFVKTLFLLPSARLVDRRLNQLRIMDGLGQSIYSTFDEDKIIGSSVSLGLRFSGADRCWAVKLDRGRFSPWNSTGKGSGAPVFPHEWYGSVLERLEKSGTLLLNRYPSSSLSRSFTSGDFKPGSLLVAPLRIRKNTFGLLCASTGRQFGFMSEISPLFETFARQVAAAVHNARLLETELERERYREEIAIARSIQESLLPGDLPVLRKFSISGISVPSMNVGGDYYDVFRISEKLYGIAIADVAGKGTAAALLMAALQSALHAIAPGFRKKAGETVSRLNSVMSERMPDDKFVTFFYGVLDPSRGTLDYCCAGHDPPLLLNAAGEATRLDRGGLILGITGETEYQTDRIDFKVGDRLLLFTDGITETMREDTEEEFGVQRLIDFIAGNESTAPDLILRELLGHLEEFRGDSVALDDMTLLMIARRKAERTGRKG